MAVVSSWIFLIVDHIVFPSQCPDTVPRGGHQSRRRRRRRREGLGWGAGESVTLYDEGWRRGCRQWLLLHHQRTDHASIETVEDWHARALTTQGSCGGHPCYGRHPPPD